ncbi:uncharacterized protein K452DRAFT_100361 [Aplosporella prunicola CBS 121167]|uniref:Centrosomin N-terminal motif 1 domain-containing protein n=1 Tax=Aplosporella prunicola CBS 121167 TaxID=1176127 RepID=A0A6A6B0U0_9PEZI|nr:uncharacterized protein K452DRAFT_100361 [Aplosporella prunicola CBS 121167]KAF2137650.1 hypothetical protein K452DRAFT_100361 [Aplosporella prunicola CBS 121167]
MDRNPVRSFSDAYRTPRAVSSHSSDQPQTPNHQLQGYPFVTTPSSTMSEPKSEKLRQMLRERREGIPDQSDVTQSAPQVSSIGLDDYIFESEGDDDHQRRRRTRLTRAMRSASIQQRGNTPSKTPNDLRMGSKDVQADMDKLRKENWDFKLRLCLMEEKSRKLQEGLAQAEDSLAAIPKLEEKIDALNDENSKLRNEVEDLQTASNQYKRNLRAANEVNGKLLAEVEQRETAVKDANEALREALDMILDLEKKVKPLEEEVARCKSNVYHGGSQDSTYFSNEPDNASIAMLSDDPSRPPTSHVTAHAADERLPIQRSRTRSSSEFASPISRHVNRLSRTISADADRLNVLRKKVSVRDDSSSNMFFDGSPEHPLPPRPHQPMRIVSNPTVSNMTGPRRGSSASLASGFVRTRRPSNQMMEPHPGSSASLASGFNSMRRPSNQTVRRLSDTPQASRTSVASDSSRGRGLRCLYLKGEAMETSQKLQTVVAPAVQEVKSPNTETANFLHALSTSSADNARTSSRATTGLSSWEVFQTSDYEAETESVAGPESVESEEENEDLTATTTVKRSSMDTELIEPLTPRLLEAETSPVPTEYRPGHYPNWPGTSKPHWVRGRDMCFNDDGVLELPR